MYSYLNTYIHVTTINDKIGHECKENRKYNVVGYKARKMKWV